MTITRRMFIKTGIIGGALLVAGGLAYEPPSAVLERTTNGYNYGFLTARDRALFACLIPVVLAGSIDASSAAQMARVLQAVDRSLQTLAPAVQNDFRQLLGLLEFPATRRLLAGIWSSWDRATAEDIGVFLGTWGRSRFSLFNGAAAGLSALIKSAWFGLPESFAAIHYPGPPAFAVKALLGDDA